MTKKENLVAVLCEKITDKLTAHGKAKSLSDRSIKTKVTKIVEKKYKDVKNDEEVDEKVFIEEFFWDFELTDGDLRKDQADFYKTKTKELEDKYKKVEPAAPKVEPNKNTDLTEVLKKISTLEEALSKQNSKETHKNKMAQIKSILKEKKIEDEDFITDYFEGRTINEESDVEELSGKVIKMYNRRVAEIEDTPPPSAGGNNKSGDDSAVVSVVKNILN